MSTWITCHRCATQFALPDELYGAAKKTPSISFWCPYGHEAHFPAGETEIDKLRRERDRLLQRMAEKDDRILAQQEQQQMTERQLSAQKGVVTRIKNRVGNGVCPCCSRSFNGLHRHMKTKHPDFTKNESVLQ
jgi:hypothetical protein